MKKIMRKRYALAYFCFMSSMLVLWFAFWLLEWHHYGFLGGLYILTLSWSLYVLCIPAVHGRMLFEIPLHFITGIQIYPEAFLWTCAAALNIITLFFSPTMYTKSFGTNVLYLIFNDPKDWVILLVGMTGAWYRTMCGFRRYNASDRKHVILRHLIFLSGSLLFLYLTSYDAIILLNAIANG